MPGTRCSPAARRCPRRTADNACSTTRCPDRDEDQTCLDDVLALGGSIGASLRGRRPRCDGRLAPTPVEAPDGRRGDLVGSLPEDTAAAFGLGLTPGWFTDVVDGSRRPTARTWTSEDLLDELSRSSGLDLPEDAETLLGESAAVSLGADLDLTRSRARPTAPSCRSASRCRGTPTRSSRSWTRCGSSCRRTRAPWSVRTPRGTGSPSGRTRPTASCSWRTAPWASRARSATWCGTPTRRAWCSTSTSTPGTAGWSTAPQVDSGAGRQPRAAQRVRMSAWVDGDVTHAVLRLTTD